MIDSETLKATAYHEAGHAVASIAAFRALGQPWPSFDRVLIRRDVSAPYLNKAGVEMDAGGACESRPIYVSSHKIGDSPKHFIDLYRKEHPEQFQSTLQRMKWEIIVSLAGPFSEAAYRGDR